MIIRLKLIAARTVISRKKITRPILYVRRCLQNVEPETATLGSDKQVIHLLFDDVYFHRVTPLVRPGGVESLIRPYMHVTNLT